GQPPDFTSTIERAVLELKDRFWLQGVNYDPWQLSALAQRLTDAGVDMREFPQTLGNLSAMGENLLGLFKDRNIEIYEDTDLAQSLRNAVGIESPRGFKIGKPSVGKKIDLVVALAMSALAAVHHERAGWGVREFYRQAAERAALGLPAPPPDTTWQDEYDNERRRLRNLCAVCRREVVGTGIDQGAKRFHVECFTKITVKRKMIMIRTVLDETLREAQSLFRDQRPSICVFGPTEGNSLPKY